MLTYQGIPFIGRVFGTNVHAQNLSNWSRTCRQAAASNMNRHFGVPTHGIAETGGCYVLPEKIGHIVARNIQGEGDVIQATIKGLGILSALIAGLGEVAEANLAAGVCDYATMTGEGEVSVCCCVGIGRCHCRIDIGAVPSAEDIFYTIYDHADGIETGITLRTAIARILAILDNKQELDDVASTMKLYDTAGTSVIRTWDMKDKTDGPISLATGTPSKRGKPS